MIRAWLIYHDLETDRYHIEERDGMEGYGSTDPAAWGLRKGQHLVVAAFQQASFLNVWLEGKQRDPYKEVN